MADSSTTFQCSVVAPEGRVVDVPTTAVVIPAHDGQRGVLAGHSPMFCKLGLGLMEVEITDPATGLIERLRLLVDGGFAVICENQIKVVSYDVVRAGRTDPEAVEALQRRLHRDLERESVDAAGRRHARRKLDLLDAVLTAP